MPTVKCKIEFFEVLQNFMHGKNQKANLVHQYMHLVETFALILNSKIVLRSFIG